MIDADLSEFLRPGQFIDSHHPEIVAFARAHTDGIASALEKACRLYRAVRDEIQYDVYIDYSEPTNFRASGVLERKRGFCVGKAALLAACCRVVEIPARVGYADVRNHMTSDRLLQIMQSDVFTWHSYAELFIDGVWVKATPAFDSALCARLGLPLLEFDGKSDSLFQLLDADGRRRMEYLQFRGTFADVPFQTILDDFRLRYPTLIAAAEQSRRDFRTEAKAIALDDSKMPFQPGRTGISRASRS
jgi:transglutaminase-like putative cysteine protease